jgi:iron(III)-salmochelin esterase
MAFEVRARSVSLVSAPVTRRAFLLAPSVLAPSVLAGCSTCGATPSPEAQRKRDEAHPEWKTLRFDPSPDAPEGQEALFFGDPKTPKPILVALHGRGEAGRGLATGARGWRDDYDLDAMRRALRAPPIEDDSVQSMESAERLAQINRSLGEHPYEDLTIVTPYTPILTRSDPDVATRFGRFVTEALLPRIVTELGVPEKTRHAIDGVSMGGRMALLVGFAYPATFASVGALQPALSTDEADTFADLARAATAREKMSLRLVSSDGDPFLEAVSAFSRALAARGVDHTLHVTRGPHDYAWNRGPGALELLLHHERVLRGLPAP